MKGFLNITKVVVPNECIIKAHAHLAKVGLLGLEGFALWVGIAEGNTFYVRETFIPAQNGLRFDAGVCVVVDDVELHRINLWLYENGLRLIAQLHSHPTEAYHSDTDDTYPIATTVGSFSLVIPDFATKPFALENCAVYRLLPPGIWTELKEKTVSQLIILD